jgi:hypothetical protein
MGDTLEGTGAVPGRGGESRKDQTHNTVQPNGVRTGCKVALLADHRMFCYLQWSNVIQSNRSSFKNVVTVKFRFCCILVGI